MNNFTNLKNFQKRIRNGFSGLLGEKLVMKKLKYQGFDTDKYSVFWQLRTNLAIFFIVVQGSALFPGSVFFKLSKAYAKQNLSHRLLFFEVKDIRF